MDRPASILQYQSRFKSTQAAVSDHETGHPLPINAELGVRINVTKNADKYLTITWSDGHVSEFSYIHLRDNCQCSECTHPTAHQRLIYTADSLDLHVQPTQHSVNADGSIEISWSDGHKSTYTASWLRLYCPTLASKNVMIQESTWDSSFEIPRHEYSKVAQSDSALGDWIGDVLKYGLCLLTGAPKDHKSVRSIADRVAFLRLTNYGDTFNVVSKGDPSNLAYTNKGLNLHTDLPYYMYSPGVQMLHCLSQAGSGGENLFVDGFRVAEEMRKRHPAEYELVVNTDVVFQDKGTDAYGDFHLRWKRPIIEENTSGRVVRFNYNNHTRDSMFSPSTPDMDIYEFYEAYFKLHHVIHDENLLIKYKLQEGEIVAFGNERVMHGRVAYQLKEGDLRELSGGYVDLDELRSRYRVIKEKEGTESAATLHCTL